MSTLIDEWLLYTDKGNTNRYRMHLITIYFKLQLIVVWANIKRWNLLRWVHICVVADSSIINNTYNNQNPLLLLTLTVCKYFVDGYRIRFPSSFHNQIFRFFLQSYNCTYINEDNVKENECLISNKCKVI